MKPRGVRIGVMLGTQRAAGDVDEDESLRVAATATMTTMMAMATAVEVQTAMVTKPRRMALRGAACGFHEGM